jgi:general secretion pathway protein N
MNRLLQDNPVGLILAGVGAFLLLCTLVITVWSFMPLDDIEQAEADPDASTVVQIPELAESQPLENYSVIVQRPVFNETRLPIVDADLESDELAEEAVVGDETDLEVELSGVVITPTLRMATLKRTDGSKSLVAMEGRYLEGEFGSWQLSRVDSREVTLTSATGKELQLELQVHDETIEPPELPVEPEEETPASTETANAEPDDNAPMTRADEIRQRIAERREELRQQAEEEGREGENEAQPSYEEAIRAMINRRPAPEEKEPETENEQ